MSQSVRIAMLSLSGLVVVGLGILGVFQYQADQVARDAALQPELPKVEAPAVPVQAQPAPPPPEAKKEIRVHVAGAVKSPGVYTLTEGAIVDEALRAAGGALPDGRPDELNLAEVLADGAKVWIPSVEELKPVAEAAPSPPPIASKGTVQPVRSTAGSNATPPAKVGGKVNINTATAKELDGVNGIGPSTAAKIIAYREEHGPFKTLDDLTKVSGIGPATLAKMRDQLTL